ncbi:MAG: hypothetical protein V4614_14850 [Pseudomonadota bacterium]
MGRRAAIPTVRSGNASVDKALSVIKVNMDQMTGQHPNVPALKELPLTATLAQVIEQLNLIVKRLQGD